ncbi:hypothetical protein SLEP1_g25199 [Rubroshorea leprosula]|uniref:Uncharacterized protein n=1 Tax=Rubroshorea leprosula TaxID=152421 RepID=A0AAV5JHY9_9ROSI|nr:hypothetical protein SLEP1_g25199 [Rubroshorea leprosula]
MKYLSERFNRSNNPNVPVDHRFRNERQTAGIWKTYGGDCSGKKIPVNGIARQDEGSEWGEVWFEFYID